MILLKFFDKFFNIGYIVAAIIFLFIVVIIIAFSKIKKRSTSFSKTIKNRKTSFRIFRINLKNNNVVYFNKNSIRKKKTVNLNTFYSNFVQEDYSKLIEWFDSIKKDWKNADQFLETNVGLTNETGKSSKNLFCLLKLINYNEKTEIITLESHLLQYIENKKIGIFNNKKYGALQRSIIQTIYKKCKKTFGYSFGVRFFLQKEEAVLNNKIEKYKTLIVKNKVYAFNTEENRNLMLDENDNEIIIFNFNMTERGQAIRFAKVLNEILKKTIQTNGFDNSLSFTISIIDNSQYVDDLDEIIKKAQEGCIVAQQKEQEILMYKNRFDINHELRKYESQINKLLQPGTLRYLFQPVVDTENQRIFAYTASIKAYNNPFSNYREMSNFATRVGKNKELFSILCNRVLNKFKSESVSGRVKLVLPVTVVDLDYIDEIVSQIPAFENVSLILSFYSNDINENSSDLEFIINSFNKIKRLGIEIALLFKDKNLLLESDFYSHFDYFFVDASMLEKIRKESVIRLSIHSLVESLLVFNKKIIAINIDNMQSVELIIKTGITLVASDAISAPNDMLLPIEPKKMKKLKDINESFN